MVVASIKIVVSYIAILWNLFIYTYNYINLYLYK